MKTEASKDSLMRQFSARLRENIMLYVPDTDPGLQHRFLAGAELMNDPNFEGLKTSYLAELMISDDPNFEKFEKGLINEVPYNVSVEVYSSPQNNGFMYHVFRGENGCPVLMLKATMTVFGAMLTEPFLIDCSLIDQTVIDLKLERVGDKKDEEDNESESDN